MTPHEHYKAAEHLLSKVEEDDPLASADQEEFWLRQAQVHATLASVVSWPTEER